MSGEAAVDADFRWALPAVEELGIVVSSGVSKSGQAPVYLPELPIASTRSSASAPLQITSGTRCAIQRRRPSPSVLGVAGLVEDLARFAHR